MLLQGPTLPQPPVSHPRSSFTPPPPLHLPIPPSPSSLPPPHLSSSHLLPPPPSPSSPRPPRTPAAPSPPLRECQGWPCVRHRPSGPPVPCDSRAPREGRAAYLTGCRECSCMCTGLPCEITLLSKVPLLNFWFTTTYMYACPTRFLLHPQHAEPLAVDIVPGRTYPLCFGCG